MRNHAYEPRNSRGRGTKAPHAIKATLTTPTSKQEDA